jgi:hypothetical protein
MKTCIGVSSLQIASLDSLVSSPTLGEEPGYGRSTTEPAATKVQGRFEKAPGFPRSLRNRSGTARGPLARARVMRVSPGKNA